jgi:hypothetical protein
MCSAAVGSRAPEGGGKLRPGHGAPDERAAVADILMGWKHRRGDEQSRNLEKRGRGGQDRRGESERDSQQSDIGVRESLNAALELWALVGWPINRSMLRSGQERGVRPRLCWG